MKTAPILRLALVMTAALSASTVSAQSYLVQKSGDIANFASYRGESSSQIIATSGKWTRYSEFLGVNDQWVHTEAHNEAVHIRNRSGGSELLVDFKHPVGRRYAVNFGDCVTSATLAEKNAKLKTEAGTFNNVVRVDFSGCGQQGLSQAWFAPGVGVVQYHLINGRAMAVIAGLTSGTVAGVNYPLSLALAVSGEVPSPLHFIEEHDATTHYLNVALSLSNKTRAPLLANFATGKRFDAALIDSKGVEVVRWSNDKLFGQAQQSMKLAPMSTERHNLRLPLFYAHGGLLDTGRYTVRLEFLGDYSTPFQANQPATNSVEIPVFIDHPWIAERPVGDLAQ